MHTPEMLNPPGRGLKKFFKVLALILLGLVLGHYHAAEDEFAANAQLPDLMELVTQCSPSITKPTGPVIQHPQAHIPNVVHQIWKDADLDTYPLEASHNQWKTMMDPLNYTVKLWTDDSILKLIQTNYMWLLSTYESYPENIQRADLARLVIVHAEGGAYADLDVYPESAEHLSCLWRRNSRGIFVSTNGGKGLSNNFFIAERDSTFLQWTLYEAKRRRDRSKMIALPYLRVFWSTGPIMITSAFRRFAWMHDRHHSLAVLDETYAGSVIHHAAGRSWHGPDGRLFNFVADNARLGKLWIVPVVLSCVMCLGCILQGRHRSVIC